MAKPSLNYVKEGPASIAIGTAIYQLFVTQAGKGRTSSGVLKTRKGKGKAVAQCNRHGGWTVIHHCWASGDVPKRLIKQAIEEGLKLGVSLTPERVEDLIRTSYNNWVRSGKKLPNNNRAV